MILDEILAHKRLEIAERETVTTLDELRERVVRRSPARAPQFEQPMSLIAEVKRRSPSAGDIAALADPGTQAQRYEAGGAAAISVLTDSRYFGGSFADLEAIRAAVEIPVLCKDFILTPYQVYEARTHGADLVLLIAAAMNDDPLIDLYRCAHDLGMTPLVEVHDQHDLARALAIDARLIGINNRDLTNFSVDLLTTDYLAPLIPDDVTVVSESGIATREDVQRARAAGARAVLVGETLMRSNNPAATIRELLS